MTIVKALKDYIIGLQHIGHIVDDLESALASFRRIYGLREESIRRVPGKNEADAPTRFAFVCVGDTEFELIEPISPASREQLLGMQSGGAGINHVAWRVSDMDACMQLLEVRGIVPGHVTPDGPVSFANKRLVYLDPATCGGLVVELIETIDD